MIKDVVRLGANDELTSRLLELLVMAFHKLGYYKKIQEEKSSTDVIHYTFLQVTHVVVVHSYIHRRETYDWTDARRYLVFLGVVFVVITILTF